MNLLIRKITLTPLSMVTLTILLSLSSLAQTATPGKNSVTIRGKAQAIWFYPATGAKLNHRVLFVAGDGGWPGWAIAVARQMAAWGYDVYGLDTKNYLASFTGSTTLKEGDVMSDFKQIAEWMTNKSGDRVTLIGWSEGAGLGVLAVAADANKETFTGLITFGLGDENVLGWSWRDYLTYVTKQTPHEPTFKAVNYMARIAPLRLLMIQSSHDEYSPLDEARRLFAGA
jgi:pimeloyl-ACP methyl ester carboxylesterase